ncbi:MAG: oligosaccharide flippase family protein [Elusimicrobia bacterium]|nr:oligosaccharide flippase family protein [Elusimicrobiota bacterium]
MMITAFGFEQEFTRRAGLNQAVTGRALKLTFVAVIASIFVAVAALAVFLAFGPYPAPLVRIIAFLMAATIVARFHLPFRHLCLVEERSDVTAVIQTIATVIVVGLTLVVIHLDGTLMQIIGVQLVIAAAITGVWFLWLDRHRPTSDPAPVTKADVIAFLRDAFPFALTNLLWIAYFNFDAFMLSLMKPAAEVGMYAGAYRIIAINYILGYAIANSFTPELFAKSLGPRKEFDATGARMMAALSAVAIPLASVLFIYSGPLVRGIIGAQYEGGVAVARILSVSVVFRMFNFGLSEILTTSGRQRTRVILETGLLIFNVLLNYFLIPSRGAAGAALATVGAEIGFFLGALVLWWRAKTAR